MLPRVTWYRDDTGLPYPLHVNTDMTDADHDQFPHSARKGSEDLLRISDRRQSGVERDVTGAARFQGVLDVSDISLEAHDDVTGKVKDEHDSGRGSEVTSVPAR